MSLLMEVRQIVDTLLRDVAENPSRLRLATAQAERQINRAFREDTRDWVEDLAPVQEVKCPEAEGELADLLHRYVYGEEMAGSIANDAICRIAQALTEMKNAP